MFELKPLTKEGVPKALEKAMRYRLLNEPESAESICRDVLACDPDHQDALVVLILALSDQLPVRIARPFQQAKALLPKIRDAYRRAYYAGVLYERRAKAHLKKGMGAADVAYDWFRRAMKSYEEAEAIRPAGNDEAILRWNTCARIINQTPGLEPAGDERFVPLLE
ncbi:MAG: hypothetical protein D6696_19990 [Acidobacteria bacterium]|nr:MAG: hypothetical protein D6696_19990 [Acidobacteriota bacterium]